MNVKPYSVFAQITLSVKFLQYGMEDFVAKIKIFSIFNTGKINHLLIPKHYTGLGKEKKKVTGEI